METSLKVVITGMILFAIGFSGTCRGLAQEDHYTIKDTAVMAARVVTNETALRPQCVPGEHRRRCVNDLAAMLQRSAAIAKIQNRSIYSALRNHSPWATGLCQELIAAETPRAELPLRCRRPTPGGNIRWTSTLNADLAETPAWRSVYPRLPWTGDRRHRTYPRAKWEQNLRDSIRWLQNPWNPCDQDPITWAGHMDFIAPWMVPTNCGQTRNTFVIRREGYRPGRETTVPANLARGD